MTDAVLKRLEAVAAKLEQYAGSVGGSSAAAGSGSAGSSSGPSAKVTAYDAWFAASAQPFIDAANAVEGTKPVVRSTTHAFAWQLSSSPLTRILTGTRQDS